MEIGQVALQVLPIFTKTEKNSTKMAYKQLDWYKKLKSLATNPHFLLSIENASSFLEEEEPLYQIFNRLNSIPHPLYLSLTWNEENRFGGGNACDVGLKNEGKRLLDFMAEKNIALDLSHASDALAFDSINYIEQKNLTLTPIASHSNARAICNKTRNLPDDIIKMIIKKNGIIGLNFVAYFVGADIHEFISHINHIESLGGYQHLSIGADFFGGIMFGMFESMLPIYFKEFHNSGCYVLFQELLKAHLPLHFIENICYKNALNFICKTPLNNKEFLKINPSFLNDSKRLEN
jgi:microsomal dipeptidase-like Zn-dependent dipeptidase